VSAGGAAVLFPGQGAIEPGMGLGLLREDPEAASLLEVASKAVGEDLARVLRRGGVALTRTEIVQPLLTAVSLAAWRAVARCGVQVDRAAGHSLGEIMALAVAADIPPDEAVRLAAERGALMARGARAHPGGMLALTTATGYRPSDRGALEAWLDQHPDLVLAAVNAPTEIVLSGPHASLEEARAAFGGRPLDVAGPWHHPTLADCVSAYHRLLAPWGRGTLRTPFVSGLDGAVVTKASEAAERVARQLVQPVRWDRVLASLRSDGVRVVLCVGTERVLRGLVRLNGWRDVALQPVVDPRSARRAVEALKRPRHAHP